MRIPCGGVPGTVRTFLLPAAVGRPTVRNVHLSIGVRD